MTVSSDTIWKLKQAAERLAVGSGSALERAQDALNELKGIRSDEFAGNVAGVLWSYVESIAKSISSGTADTAQITKFNISIWQLFDAYRQ
jgi:hypothetical protein